MLCRKEETIAFFVGQTASKYLCFYVFTYPVYACLQKISFDKCKYTAQIPTRSQHKTPPEGTGEALEAKVSNYSRCLNVDALCVHTGDGPGM